MTPASSIVRTARVLALAIVAWTAGVAMPVVAGTMQSPIDIVTADVVYSPGRQGLAFHYSRSASLTLTDINATNEVDPGFRAP